MYTVSLFSTCEKSVTLQHDWEFMRLTNYKRDLFLVWKRSNSNFKAPVCFNPQHVHLHTVVLVNMFTGTGQLVIKFQEQLIFLFSHWAFVLATTGPSQTIVNEWINGTNLLDSGHPFECLKLQLIIFNLMHKSHKVNCENVDIYTCTIDAFCT